MTAARKLTDVLDPEGIDIASNAVFLCQQGGAISWDADIDTESLEILEHKLRAAIDEWAYDLDLEVVE